MGVNSLEEHLTIIEEIKKHSWKNVVLVGGDFMKVNHPFLQFSSTAEAGLWLKSNAQNARLLIKGSRSMQMEKVLEYL